MRVQIFYKGKYGATETYAKWLAETFHCEARKVGQVTNEDINGDIILLGSSVYVGQMQLKKWIQANSSLLERKRVFLFVVSATDLKEVKKLHEYLKSTFPAGVPTNYKVEFLPGRMIYRALSLGDKIMLRLGAFLTRGKEEKQKMLTDFDHVNREALSKLIHEVKSHINPDAENCRVDCTDEPHSK